MLANGLDPKRTTVAETAAWLNVMRERAERAGGEDPS